MIKSNLKFSPNSLSLLSFTKKCKWKKKHIRKQVSPIGGNSIWNVNEIDFMTFVIFYMMTKRKLYDKEHNSIWISKCFIRLRIMKNHYVTGANSVDFNYTLYIGLFISGMAAVSFSSDKLGFSNILTLPFNSHSFFADYLKINFNSQLQKFLKFNVR
jgi:hypothetical protein